MKITKFILSSRGNNGSSNVLITPGLSFNGKSALSNFESRYVTW